MKRTLLVLALVAQLFSQASVQGQAPSPGNVPQPCLWLRADTVGTGVHYMLWDRYAGANNSVGSASSVPPNAMNFHGVPAFTSIGDPRWLIADSISPTGSTMFMVAKPVNTDERVLWAMEVADTGRAVLSNKRSADLNIGLHLLHDQPNDTNARMIAHIHRADTSFSGEVYIRVGTPAPTPPLPISGFEGTLPEVLYFDRVLGTRERTRLSSYLAIKYGLTLLEEDLVNSGDRPVWAYKTYRNYSHHVFAIAKDSASVLDQRQATSAMEAGFLAFGVDTITTWHARNPALIPDGHYLITGDDGRPRTWKPREPGQPQFTARTWHMQRTGPTVLNTRMRLNAAMMLNAPEKAENYWLVIDRSGTGSFDPGGTEFVQAMPGPNEGTVDLNGVFWDIDGTGSDRYRFAAGGSFIPMTWIDPPNCDPPSPGSLTVQVPGGEAPIMARLNGIGHDAFVEAEVAADTLTTIQLLAGEYELTLTDNTGYTIQDRIWIQPKDAPRIVLAPQYELTAQEPLVFNATVPGTISTYEWRFNGDIIATTAQLVVERPGEYTCTASADGCPTRVHTVVSTRSPDTGIDIGVMPNPSLDGNFIIQVTLREKVDAQLTIASLQGTLVRQRMLRDQDFHRLQEHISGAGQYIISVTTVDGQRFTRVIVL
ncbi:MAG TPA: T9SS type A sorting domain-containing protein [Flavobacteriales bacterium]|nr:T9SS type A sorting domain-containing protein [Flavobacteriales bacterium]